MSHPLCCWFQPTRVRPVWVEQAWTLGYRLNGCWSMFAIRRHVWYTDCWMHLWNLYFKVGSNLLAGRLVFCSAFWEVSGKVAGCRLESYPGLWCASTSARFASKDGVLGAKSLLRSTSGKCFFMWICRCLFRLPFCHFQIQQSQCHYVVLYCSFACRTPLYISAGLTIKWLAVMWAINILQRQQIQGPFLVIILLKRNEWFKERLLALWVDFEGFDNIRSIDVSCPFMGLYDCWSPTFFDQLIAAPAAGIWGYDLPNLAKEQLHLSLRCVGILVQNRIHASKCVLCCDFAQTKRDFWGFKVGIVFWNEVEPESIASCYTSARSRLIGQLGHILAQAPLDTTDISTTILECGIGPSAIGNLSITLIWGYSIYIPGLLYMAVKRVLLTHFRFEVFKASRSLKQFAELKLLHAHCVAQLVQTLQILPGS